MDSRTRFARRATYAARPPRTGGWAAGQGRPAEAMRTDGRPSLRAALLALAASGRAVVAELERALTRPPRRECPRELIDVLADAAQFPYESPHHSRVNRRWPCGARGSVPAVAAAKHDRGRYLPAVSRRSMVLSLMSMFNVERGAVLHGGAVQADVRSALNHTALQIDREAVKTP